MYLRRWRGRAACVACSVVAVPLAMAVAAIVFARVLGTKAHAQADELTLQSADEYRAAIVWATSYVLFIGAAAWNVLVCGLLLRRFATVKMRIFIILLVLLFTLGSPYIETILGGKHIRSTL